MSLIICIAKMGDVFYDKIRTSGKEIIIAMTLLNKSTRALNISRIELFSPSGRLLECIIRKTRIMEHFWGSFGNDSNGVKEMVFSTEFPLHIESRGCNYLIVVFKDDNNADRFKTGDRISMIIHTDKKSVKIVCAFRECKDKNDLVTIY